MNNKFSRMRRDIDITKLITHHIQYVKKFQRNLLNFFLLLWVILKEICIHGRSGTGMEAGNIEEGRIWAATIQGILITIIHELSFLLFSAVREMLFDFFSELSSHRIYHCVHKSLNLSHKQMRLDHKKRRMPTWNIYKSVSHWKEVSNQHDQRIEE